MTPAPAAPAPDQATREERHLTDDQIVEVVRSLVRLHLEIERGLRPPQHLAPYLTPVAQRHLDLHPRTTFPRGGPVHPRDIGHPRLSSYPDGRIYATLTAREQHDRWSAMVIQLVAGRDGQLAVSELQRVPQRPQARQLEPAPRPDLRGLRARVEQERQVVEAAHLAESPGPSSANSHERRLAELDRELADLRKRIEHRDEVEATKHTVETTPQYVSKLLGDPPAHNTWRRHLWDTARNALDEYRERYRIGDTTALGPPPTTDGQQEARDKVICTVRTALRSGRDHDPELARARFTFER